MKRKEIIKRLMDLSCLIKHLLQQFLNVQIKSQADHAALHGGKDQ